MPCKHCQDEAEYVIKDGQFAKIGTDMDGCHLHVFLVSSKWSFSSLLWRVPVSFCPWCGHYLGGEMETEITGCEFLGYSQNNLPRFCGSDSAPVLSDCVEVEACVCFEDCKDGLAKCVVCDIHKGGCGASGGFAYSEEEAIKRWNARPNCGAEVVNG